MTLEELTGDIMVSMGYTHDDARSRIAVMANVKMAVDKVLGQLISKAVSKSDFGSISDSLSVFTVPVEYHEAGDDTMDFDHHSFTLPVELYSLQGDMGLAWIRYNRNGLPKNCPPQLARARFSGTTLGAMSGIYASPYQHPCEKTPWFARDKDRVYVFGVNPLVKVLLVGLYCTLPDMADVDPNAELPLPADSVYSVKRLVMEAERWVFQIPQQRLHNDGRDLEPANGNKLDKIIGLNDPLIRPSE